MACAIWALWWPIPSSHLVFASSYQGGVYHKWAQTYAEKLALRGLSVQVLETGGSSDNFKYLTDTHHKVDVAFLQGGFSSQNAPHWAHRTVMSLGRVDVEPIWIFSRVSGLQRLSQLEGLRVSIGPIGSGTHAFMQTLIERSRITPEKLHLRYFEHDKAVAALAKDQLDVMFGVLPAESPVVKAALQTTGVSLVNLQSAALVQKIPFLQIKLLAQGVLAPQGPMPPEDMTVMVVPTELVARADLHPALQRQLIRVAHELHATAGLFRKQGEMPAASLLEWPASPQIRAMSTESLPLIERHLPFWEAQFLLRFLYLILPALLLGLLIGWIHWKYQLLLAENRLVHWYGELRLIEQDLSNAQGVSLSSHRHTQRLRSIREHLAQTPIPVRLKKRQLKLLEHIDFVRIRIHKLRGR